MFITGKSTVIESMISGRTSGRNVDHQFIFEVMETLQNLLKVVPRAGNTLNSTLQMDGLYGI